MPKIKPSPIKKAGDIVNCNIKKRGIDFGCRTGPELEKKTGISKRVFNDHFNKPRRWTLEQLVWIAEAFHTPLEWFFTDHSKEVGQ